MGDRGDGNEWRRDDGFVVSDDPVRLDLDAIHAFLSTCYWATGIPREVVERSIAYSLCFGVYAPASANGDAERGLVGFARAITDRATFAYLADVFIVEEYRGRGLSKFLMACIVAHPDLLGLRRWMLLTGDAHGLYEKFGFRVTDQPERVMQWRPPVGYGPNASR